MLFVCMTNSAAVQCLPGSSSHHGFLKQFGRDTWIIFERYIARHDSDQNIAMSSEIIRSVGKRDEKGRDRPDANG